MKKVLILLLLVAMMLSFCACKSTEVKNVEAMINGLSEMESIDLDQVIEVQEAYSELSDQDRAKVGNYSILKDAYEESYQSLCDRLNELGEACDCSSTNTATIWSNVGPDELMSVISYIAYFSFEDSTWEDYVEAAGDDFLAEAYLYQAARGILGDDATEDDITDEESRNQLLADCVEYKKEINIISDNYEELFDDISAFRNAFKDDFSEEIGTLNDWNTTLNQYAKLCLSPDGSYVTYTDTISEYRNDISQFSTVADSYY